MPNAPSSTPPASVLVIRLGAVGDVIRTLPAVSCLRQAWPEARIGWAVESPSRAILEGHPDIDRVHVLARRSLRLLTFPAALRGFARELGRGGYDRVVDLHGTFKSALMARMSGIPKIYGFGPGHSREKAHLLYTDPLPLPRKRMSRVDRALCAVEMLGVDVSSPRRTLPERPEAARMAEAFLQSLPPARPRLLISPGTSAAQAFKRYPAPLFARLGDAFIGKTGGAVILAWGPGEESIIEEIRDLMKNDAVVTPPTSLLELAEVARRCDLFIGSDTGPMHVAAAVDTPVIALYGPTDAVTNAPWTQRPHLELEGETWCRPCRNRGCLSRACLWGIDPEMIAVRATALIDGAASS